MLAGKQPHASQELKGDTKRITDGIAAPEGSAWDAPITVTLGSGAGFITYDLGELRTVSAVVMQGDANDVYKVTGSPDGSRAASSCWSRCPTSSPPGTACARAP